MSSTGIPEFSTSAILDTRPERPEASLGQGVGALFQEKQRLRLCIVEQLVIRAEEGL